MNSFVAKVYQLETFASTNREVEEGFQRDLLCWGDSTPQPSSDAIEGGTEVEECPEIVRARGFVDTHQDRASIVWPA